MMETDFHESASQPSHNNPNAHRPPRGYLRRAIGNVRPTRIAPLRLIKMFMIQSIEYKWEKSERGSKFASERSLLPEKLLLDCNLNNGSGIALDERGSFLNHSEGLASCNHFNIKYDISTDLLKIEFLSIQPLYGLPPSTKVNKGEWILLKYNYREVEPNHSVWFFEVRIINVGNFSEFRSDVFIENDVRRVYDFQRNIYRISK